LRPKAVIKISESKDGFAVSGPVPPLSLGIGVWCPTRALADAVAAEWRDLRNDPDDKPQQIITHLAIQAAGIKSNFDAAVESVAAYGASDLLCYRGAEGSPLAKRQAQLWQPILDWVLDRHGIALAVTHDIAPIDQDPKTLDRITQLVEKFDPYQLATVSQVTSLCGSVLIALALLDNAIDEARAWEAGALDENFQIETWGKDTEAMIALAAKRRALAAAVRFDQLARDHG
jgi:chaperone required for assembly of F1-ATPase